MKSPEHDLTGKSRADDWERKTFFLAMGISAFLIVAFFFWVHNNEGRQDAGLRDGLFDDAFGRAEGNLTVLDDFERGIDGFVFERFGRKDDINEPTIRMNASIASGVSFDGNSSMMIEFNFGEYEAGKHIKIYKRISQNWSRYGSVQLSLKPDGSGGVLQFWVVDEDGDWWHYASGDVLHMRNWTSITIPFESLEAPGENFPFRGNGVKNLDRVTNYRIRIDQPTPDNLGEDRVLYIDRIALG
ncbi:MAG: carbohydrate binding domain-containing protein [archaeon]